MQYDIRNPAKKYTAQELDVVVTATVKDNGFQIIKSFKHPITDDTAFTLFTNGKRFIAVFTTANDITPQANHNGEIIDQKVMGKITLDELLQLYKKLIEQYQREHGNKAFELIIPLCLCPKDPKDPKHIVYLKIHKSDNKMNAVIFDSTTEAHWALENIGNALRKNFASVNLEHPVLLNDEKKSSNGLNDGPFTVENIRMDLANEEMFDQNHTGKTAKQLRGEQFAIAQPLFEKMRTNELASVHSQLVANIIETPKHNIKIDETESTLEDASAKAQQNLHDTLNEIESLQNLSNSKRQSVEDISKKPTVNYFGQHRKMYQETTKSETIKQQLCLTKLNKLKNELCLVDWKEKTAKYNLTKHQIVDPKEKLNSKQENIIQVPKVIATILAKINAANDSNAEQIMREIRSIANAASQDAKRNLWKPSEETKKICENIVKIIDLNLPKLDTPIPPTYKK